VEAGPGRGGGFLVAARFPLGGPPPGKAGTDPASAAAGPAGEQTAPVTGGTRS
jgi:hypothetical protein